jgi:hypothetical protein
MGLYQFRKKVMIYAFIQLNDVVENCLYKKLLSLIIFLSHELQGLYEEQFELRMKYQLY